MVGAGELDQPLAMVRPATLDRERARHHFSIQSDQPDRAARSEHCIGLAGEGEQRAIALQSVRLAQPAHHQVAAGVHQTAVGLNTPTCLSSDCTVSDGVAPLEIQWRALSAST